MTGQRESPLQLNLLQNSLDYLNTSLEYVVKARTNSDQTAWKAALLNLTFCIELMLKERLRREHALLVYADIDKYRAITRETKTVSWTVLRERLRYILGEGFVSLDSGRLDLAAGLRNQMLHYDVLLEFPSVYHHFANLLNFVAEFFNTFIRASEEETLHQYVRKELWYVEESLSTAFVEQIVYYNGIFMAKGLKEDIEKEQSRTTIVLEGDRYDRVRYGDPIEYAGLDIGDYWSQPCGDCSVAEGQVHLLGCDVERCPRCRRQLISCWCQSPDPDLEKNLTDDWFHKYNAQFDEEP